MLDINKLKVVELKKLAVKYKIVGRSKMKKMELIQIWER